MGSIRSRADTGMLFFDFRFQGKRCREQTTLEDNPVNRKRMEKALAKIEFDIEAGTFDYATTFPGSRKLKAPSAAVNAGGGYASPTHPLVVVPPVASAPPTPTFAEFCATWIAEHKIEWRRSHLKVLNSTVDKYLLPEFGAMQVSQIDKGAVLAFRAKLAEQPGRGGRKLSNKRINSVMGPLRQILNEASDRFGFVAAAAKIKPLKIKKGDVDPFTLEEVRALIDAVRPDYKDYFTVRFFTGMRTGEIHGLKWQYVDFDKRLILVRETFVLGEDEYTKTDYSQRDIQMSQPVYEALKRQQLATGKATHVFCNRVGEPLDNKNFTDRVWYPVLRLLGLKSRRPYQTRHTAATLWLASGEAPEWIANQLGHANAQMLFQVYSRYVPNMIRRDGSAFDRLLNDKFVASSQAQPPPG